MSLLSDSLGMLQSLGLSCRQSDFWRQPDCKNHPSRRDGREAMTWRGLDYRRDSWAALEVSAGLCVTVTVRGS